MPCRSASPPSTAAPMPPMPNAKPKKQPRHRAHLPRHQFLCEHDDGGECGGQYQADDEAQDPRPHQVDVGQDHGEGRHAQDGHPDDALAPDAVADVSAEQGAERHREQKYEQIDLRRAHRQMKFLDEVETVIAGDAGCVKVFRENQQHEDADGPCDGARGDRSRPRGRAHGAALQMLMLVPGAHPRQHRDGQQRGNPEPGEACLAVRKNDHRGEQRAHGAAGVSAHLEDRLGQAVAAARRQPGNPRGFGMKDGGARADQSGRGEDTGVVRRERQCDYADQRKGHAHAQRVRLGMLVGEGADDGLQHGGANLVRQRDDADLRETQMEFALEQRVDRDHQGLHHVVEKVREADRSQHPEARLSEPGRRRGGGVGQFGGETLVHGRLPTSYFVACPERMPG